ncbi:hypothetical protein G9A89_001442 [Geosiphon pyriformis]|nr:hypothetical protein G9A89_001442 [Geosiphon pyriformis]
MTFQPTVHPLEPLLQSLFRLQQVLVEQQLPEILEAYIRSFLSQCDFAGVAGWKPNQFDTHLDNLTRYIQFQRFIVIKLYEVRFSQVDKKIHFNDSRKEKRKISIKKSKEISAKALISNNEEISSQKMWSIIDSKPNFRPVSMVFAENNSATSPENSETLGELLNDWRVWSKHLGV